MDWQQEMIDRQMRWTETEGALKAAFAKGVRLQRVQNNWTQSQLADLWQISRPAAAKMESGDRRPTMFDIAQACELFDVDVFDFLLLPRLDGLQREYVWEALMTLFPEGKARRAWYF